jgi:hypothetical protein
MSRRREEMPLADVIKSLARILDSVFPEAGRTAALFLYDVRAEFFFAKMTELRGHARFWVPEKFCDLLKRAPLTVDHELTNCLVLLSESLAIQLLVVVWAERTHAGLL